MKKALLLSFVSFFIFNACNDDEQIINSSPIVTNVDIRVQDSKGIDLLNTSTTNLAKNLKVYYLENGEWKLYFESNLDASAGYNVFKGTNSYILRLFPKINKKTLEIKSLLKWENNSIPDTITTQYSEFGNGGLVNDKVYLNGKLAYTKGSATPLITIIK